MQPLNNQQFRHDILLLMFLNQMGLLQHQILEMLQQQRPLVEILPLFEQWEAQRREATIEAVNMGDIVEQLILHNGFPTSDSKN